MGWLSHAKMQAHSPDEANLQAFSRNGFLGTPGEEAQKQMRAILACIEKARGMAQEFANSSGDLQTVLEQFTTIAEKVKA